MAEKEKGFVVKDRRAFSQDDPSSADEKKTTDGRPEAKDDPQPDTPPRAG